MLALSRDSLSRRRTFPPEYVSRCVHVAVVDRSAIAALPHSYFQTLSAFRAADASAVRTGLRAVPFVGLNVLSPVRNRFVAEHVAEHRPAGIAYGATRKRTLHGLAVHVTDDDPSKLAHEADRLLVQMMAARVRDLRRDSPCPAFLARSLRPGESRSAPIKMARVGDLGAIGERRKIFQTKIHADRTSAAVHGFRHLAREVEIPPAAGILAEAAGTDVCRNWATKPQAVRAAEHANAVSGRMDYFIAVRERNPSKRPPATPARASSYGLTCAHEQAARFRNGFRWNAKFFATTGRQLHQVVGRRPTPVPLPRMFLHVAAIVPDEIDGPRHARQTALSGPRFDAIAVGQNHTANVGRGPENSRLGGDAT